MGTMRTWGGLAIALGLLAGCGRSIADAPLPLNFSVPMTPESGRAETGLLVLADLGTDASVSFAGTGFQPGGIYTLHMVDRAQGGLGDWLHRPASTALVGDTSQISVSTDGSATLVGSFSIRDPAPSWDAIEVRFHPDGEPANARGAQVIMRAPVPEVLRP